MASHRPALMSITASLLSVWSSFGLVELGCAEEKTALNENEYIGLNLQQLMEIELGDLNPMGIHHTHKKGEVMVGYSFSSMQMEGNRDGRSRVSIADVLTDFMIAPTEMSMAMQMLGIMYAPSDKLTVMTMVPYVNKSMKHINRGSVRFKTSSAGIGDVKTSLLYQIYRTEQHLIYVSGGLGLPTGSVSERDTTPMGNVRLPYPMQLGSGTFDLWPGIAYLGKNQKWDWGAHAGSTIRLGENKHDYRLGNSGTFTTWLARGLTDQVNLHARLDGSIWNDIHGADAALNPAMVPTADPSRRGGQRIDAGLGLNVRGTQGGLEGHQFSVEFRMPVHQRLHGPQLETDWILSLGWQKVFD